MKHLLSIVTLLILTVKVAATDHLATSPEQAVQLLNQAVAGDRILLKDGTYKDAAIQFLNANGTKEKPVTFSAQTPGKVYFEGNSTLAFGGNYIIISGFVWQHGGEQLEEQAVISFRTGKQNAVHCTVQDCAIDDYNNSNFNTDNKWVSLFGQSNTLTRCILKSKRNIGATVTVWLQEGLPAKHLISYNYFLNRYNGPGADNGLESIRIGDSRSSFTEAHCIVAFNRFEACDGEIEIISNKSCHNTYLHNTFMSSDGGLTLRHGNDCLCDGNYFDGSGKKLSYGIRFIGEGHVAINNYFTNLQGAPNQNFRAPVSLVNGLENTPLNGYFQVKRAIIGNNVFVNNAMPAIRVGVFSKRPGMTLAPDTITISDNIIFDNTGNSGPVYEEKTAPAHLRIINNSIYGRSLATKEKGFNTSGANMKWQKDGSLLDEKGNPLPAAIEKAAIATMAGANWMDESLLQATKGKKYTYMSPQQVGPSWR